MRFLLEKDELTWVFSTLSRKRVVMLRKVVWTLMPMCLLDRRQSIRKEERVGSGLPVDAD